MAETRRTKARGVTVKTFNKGDVVECILANSMPCASHQRVYKGRLYRVTFVDSVHGFLEMAGVEGRFSYDRFELTKEVNG